LATWREEKGSNVERKNEILSFEKDLKKGLDDIKKRRYKIIG